MLVNSSAEFLDRFGLDRQLLAAFVRMPSMKGDTLEAIELGAGSTRKIINVNIVESISGQVVEEFKASMRPLFFGTAWRVVDGLIELALARDPSTPSGALGWQPAAKKALVQQGYGTLTELQNAILDPIKALYVSTIEVRHALIHRKTKVSPDGALVGHTNAGSPLSPVNVEQQEHMCELAQWLAVAIDMGSLTAREQRRVTALLVALTTLHGQVIQSPPPLGNVMLVRYQLDNTGVLDLEAIRTCVGDVFGMDLQVTTEGGTLLAGEADDVQDASLVIDLANLPAWLSITQLGADAP